MRFRRRLLVKSLTLLGCRNADAIVTPEFRAKLFTTNLSQLEQD